jgi:Guanosine polyphosphate pyrophosphohydrolases/synthetases
MSMDPPTIIAGLLHDVIEDTIYNEEFIRNEFGDEVAKLVKAVQNLFGKKGYLRRNYQN